MTELIDAPFKATSFIPRDITVETREDGTILMASRIALELTQPNLPSHLRHRAAERPDSVWISEPVRSAGIWRSITFAQARAIVDSLAQALLDMRIPAGRTLALLSANSIEHALISYAAFQVGIPIVPLTPAYALQRNGGAQLRARLSQVDPAIVFVQNARLYGPALDTIGDGVRVIAVDDADPAAGHFEFARMAATIPTKAVEDAFAAIDADATARLMFTSGSSGNPKVVIQTQRNILVAVESNLVAFGQRGGKGVTRLDWMPWSHVTGAAVLAATLISGGTFYVDDGRPLGDEFARTLANLRHVSPTNYFSMPAGYVMLADALEQDAELAASFFANLLTMGYGGARMPDDVARRLQALAIAHTGFKIPITCGYGSTETGPGGALVYWPTDRVGLIGLPHPGYDLKLVPIDDERYEVRVRSAAVAPGYLGLSEQTAQMRDEEGYFRMGDAASFVDPRDPAAGLVFAGRISDEFKLVTGTFVRAGEMHDMLMLVTAPLLQHLVLCGEGEAFVAMLGWLNVKAAREIVGQPDATLAELNRHPLIREKLEQSIAAYNRDNRTSSRRIKRFSLQDDMPSGEAGELADKGSIRAGNVRRLRADAVADLFAERPSSDVVTLGDAAPVQ